MLLVEGKDEQILTSPSDRNFSSSPGSRLLRPGRNKSPNHTPVSPALIKGDLHFNVLPPLSARAIAEWGPSPTGTHFSSQDLASPHQNNRSKSDHLEPSHEDSTVADMPSSAPSSAFLRPSFHSQCQTSVTSPPATPFTPLTPGPYSSPQHREATRDQRRPSLKHRKVRHRPTPLQLSPQPLEIGHKQSQDFSGIKKLHSVRFADGSPMRGSTWHLNQYPERLASPPISAANLTLADLVELESIKQSLGTWCGEMMGSFIRSSSLSDSQDQIDTSSDAYSQSADIMRSPTLSDADWKARWPISPAFSDCDSEIFEGMH
ncbi:uncharacterized protein MELLADRAFT_107400 [Melampsora larici-populina 98AG31]|uniref:Uncharacterized protein n=1 Tax=Melampsora larici-populina (strain 98AG31 / pathotype 3-4-7) TaxID=747676 RepID=F4RPP0_MELLP|nr:uncharacterized protein MELLADRAFT_107400 [Melampsora larici-populina 98AG31]EGG05697.1 hypothetical protein MELLADRAFT_107400 [Melampsora larici-populina 98AG31]